MIIKEIIIENFRCYYEKNTIKLGEGLNLFIGDNGDGKTTFIEALEWLFNTSLENKDPNLISRKKSVELSSEEIATVSVSIKFEHDGEKSISKAFDFERDGDKLSTFNYRFEGLDSDRIEREPIAGSVLLDRCFDASIRQYSLFKGEEELDVFNNQNALQNLVTTFSNIRDFDPYLSFLEFSNEESQKAYRSAVRLDKKNTDRERQLSGDIDYFTQELNSQKKRLANIENEAKKYSEYIENFERNRNASEALNTINTSLKAKRDDQARILNRIKDNYSIRLLDDEWILCGIPSILEEFEQKVSEASKARRKEEKEAIINQGKKEVIKELSDSIAQGIAPLSLTIPDEATMKEMLDDEFCKVCGRPAEKDSEAYLFMKMKLDKLVESNLPQIKNKDEEHFPNNFIKELEQRRGNISYEKGKYCQLGNVIQSDIEFNNKQKSEERKLQNEIEELEESKLKLLANTGNISEQDLENIYNNLANWYRSKIDAEKEKPRLEIKMKEVQNKLEQAKKDYDDLATNSTANIFQKINSAFERILAAFDNAKDKNTREFLALLAKEANLYLSQLNVEDFFGVISIIEDYSGAKLKLNDSLGEEVYNPSQSQLTTMRMSVLFAISKLTTLKRENDYPLIFDAPTSSFGVIKERDFFNLISAINKQCIIFTKNFIEISKETGKAILNKEEIDKMQGRVYRIEKRKPFDNKDLSTIQTQITPIN